MISSPMILSGGIDVLGLPIPPAIFAFGLVIIGWGLLNLLEFRRFD